MGTVSRRFKCVLLAPYILLPILGGCSGLARTPLSFSTCVFSAGYLELPRQHEGSDPRGNYITAHRQGGPADLYGNHLAREEFVQEYVKAIKEGFDLYVTWGRHQKGNGRPQLLLFVHGGLNTYEEALARAETLTYTPDNQNFRLLKFGTDSSEGYGPRYYPVFVNWEASFSEAVCDDLVRVRAGREDRRWAVPTSPLILAKRFGEGALGMFSNLGMMAVDLAEGVRGEEEGKVEYLAFNFPLLPLRFTWSPFIQGFGTPAWQMLYRRTDFMVRTPVREGRERGTVGVLIDRLLCDSAKITPCLEIKEQKEFFGEKSAIWNSNHADDNDPQKKSSFEIDITLVGHSMGTLVLDSLIQEFSQIPFRRIVYLASASSIEDIKASVIPQLRYNKNSEFYAFNLSRINEVREMRGWGLAPQGSLLVWIDSFFGGVYTPMQLRFGRESNLKDVRFNPPSDVKNRFWVGIFRGRGKGEPKNHGDFDEPDVLPRILCTIDEFALTGCSYTEIEWIDWDQFN
jgi:hypothetical protein